MFDRMRVTRARSTSTKICSPSQYLVVRRPPVIHLTLPSVTVRSVSITLSFTSKFGVSSRKPITTWTIFEMACLSCPCFLLSSCTCSFSRLQSPDSFDIVTMATIRRDVEGRSEDCRVCFSKLSNLSMACCVWPFCADVSLLMHQVHPKLRIPPWRSFQLREEERRLLSYSPCRPSRCCRQTSCAALPVVGCLPSGFSPSLRLAKVARKNRSAMIECRRAMLEGDGGSGAVDVSRPASSLG